MTTVAGLAGFGLWPVLKKLFLGRGRHYTGMGNQGEVGMRQGLRGRRASRGFSNGWGYSCSGRVRGRAGNYQGNDVSDEYRPRAMYKQAMEDHARANRDKYMNRMANTQAYEWRKVGEQLPGETSVPSGEWAEPWKHRLSKLVEVSKKRIIAVSAAGRLIQEKARKWTSRGLEDLDIGATPIKVSWRLCRTLLCIISTHSVIYTSVSINTSL